VRAASKGEFTLTQNGQKKLGFADKMQQNVRTWFLPDFSRLDWLPAYVVLLAAGWTSS
jgi:hypothetical protein